MTFYDFSEAKPKFHDFPGLENEIIKFHNFPGFPRPIPTPSLFSDSYLFWRKSKVIFFFDKIIIPQS